MITNSDDVKALGKGRLRIIFVYELVVHQVKARSALNFARSASIVKWLWHQCESMKDSSCEAPGKLLRKTEAEAACSPKTYGGFSEMRSYVGKSC